MGVIVELIQGCVVVEVLLNMNDVKAELGELATNGGGVIRLVPGHLVVLQKLRQASDVEGQRSEGTRGGSKGTWSDCRSEHASLRVRHVPSCSVTRVSNDHVYIMYIP